MLVNFLNVLDFLLFDTYYALFINLFLQYFGGRWSTGLGRRAKVEENKHSFLN